MSGLYRSLIERLRRRRRARRDEAICREVADLPGDEACEELLRAWEFKGILPPRQPANDPV